MSKRLVGLLAALALALTAVASASGASQQQRPLTRTDAKGIVDNAGDTNMGAVPDAAHHGPMSGHLPPSHANVDLVGKLRLSGVVPGRVADVATYRNTAYLAAWSVQCPGGFWSVDISNPRRPKQLTFVSAPPGSYLTEGMHALRLTTPTFTGNVLVVSNETCAEGGQGGISIYDVTHPAAPVPLAIGQGDTDFTAPLAHDSHSVFAWDTGSKAYAVFVDNLEGVESDVDIADITDPRNPRLIKETGLADWPAAQDNMAFGESAFLHDVVVRRVEGHWLMLLSYWDAGFVVLNVDDPANPVYLKDSDYPAVDPLTGIPLPEGNAHEAEWDRCPEEGVRSRFPCGDVRYILGADEDFSVSRPTLEVTTGPNAGAQASGEFEWTLPLAQQFPDGVTGPTVFGGTGCPGQDANGNTIDDREEVPEAATIAVNPGEVPILVLLRGGTPEPCFFSDKVRTGEEKGYQVVLIGNHHNGAGGGLFPNAFICGSQGSEVLGTASGLCIGHRLTHLLFNDAPEYDPPAATLTPDMPAVGAMGERVTARGGVFDAWGYLHLIDADTMEIIDNYSIPEALDPRFGGGAGLQTGSPGGGFGDLTVHEITTDPTGDVGYVAWYSAGFRVVDYSGGTLREVGHYIDVGGNDFWGVELNVRRDGRLFALASDRDYGLYIFRFGTDLKTRLRGARTGRVGRMFTLSARVRNTGTIDETNARWTLRLPRGLHAMAASPAQGRCSLRERTVRCKLGRVRENASVGVSIRVHAARAGRKRLTAFVNGRKAEYDIGNNRARRIVRIRAARSRTAAATAVGAGAAGLTGRQP
ncbi:MAG: hypothetical protein M3327_15500 [Actinomycetota bacterium]|nr:hypothetical protein [Actinomycetota bacterium]